MKGTTIGRMAYLWEKCEIAEISLIKGAGYTSRASVETETVPVLMYLSRKMSF